MKVHEWWVGAYKSLRITRGPSTWLRRLQRDSVKSIQPWDAGGWAQLEETGHRPNYKATGCPQHHQNSSESQITFIPCGKGWEAKVEMASWRLSGYNGLWRINNEVVDGSIQSFSILLSPLVCAKHWELKINWKSPSPPGSHRLHEGGKIYNPTMNILSKVLLEWHKPAGPCTCKDFTLGLMLCWWASATLQIHSFCKDLLRAYSVSDTPLGTEDKTDTNPGQATANNYVKHTGCQWG